jgi:hypothetical protein
VLKKKAFTSPPINPKTTAPVSSKIHTRPFYASRRLSTQAKEEEKAKLLTNSGEGDPEFNPH